MEQTFQTSGRTSLYVEIGSGHVDVRATEEDRVVVRVDGDDAEDVTVEQRGDRVVVIGPQRRTGFFSSSRGLDVQVSLPHDSDLATKLGSADLVVSGAIGTASLKTGSGYRPGRGGQRRGAGRVRLGRHLHRPGRRGPAGQGRLGRRHGPGARRRRQRLHRVRRRRDRPRLRRRPGEDRLRQTSRVRRPEADVALSTASGDLTVDLMGAGELAAKNVSGDIRVGVPSGLPVWTDISTLSGSVRSNLEGAGQPGRGPGRTWSCGPRPSAATSTSTSDEHPRTARPVKPAAPARRQSGSTPPPSPQHSRRDHRPCLTSPHARQRRQPADPGAGRPQPAPRLPGTRRPRGRHALATGCTRSPSASTPERRPRPWPRGAPGPGPVAAPPPATGPFTSPPGHVGQ